MRCFLLPLPLPLHPAASVHSNPFLSLSVTSKLKHKNSFILSYIVLYKTQLTEAKRPGPNLNLRFDAPEPERSSGQLVQLEGFGRLLSLRIRTLHLNYIAVLTQDQQPVFTLAEIFTDLKK